MSTLISTDELSQSLASPDMVVLDCSWYMPSEHRDPAKEYAASHISDARFFDIDAVCDTASPYPHMLPSPERFAQAVGTLGISNSTNVVVYDGAGLFSAARVWWMFRVFGHDKVRVLDGGLLKWKAEAKPVSSILPEAQPATFTPRYRSELVRKADSIAANCTTNKEQVIDARASGRFNGTDPEPRANLRSGHIPGSINLPFRECTSPPFQTLKSVTELTNIFQQRGIDIAQPLVASCGSGVTACVLALALYELGAHNVAVYDGAWAEWASLNP